MSYDYIDQIKSKISPSSLLSRYISLKSKGNGEYLGLCPFHDEKTPSFTVSDRKLFYHCFGCGANGDIISFLMNYAGVSYNEAIEQLAKEASVDIPDKKSAKEKDEFAELYNIFEVVADFYQRQLYSRDGAEALQYLQKRGVSEESVKFFRLGYAPKSDYKLLNLLRDNFSEPQILASKIFLKGSGFYSPFKDRVMFPIKNKKGKIIAFGGRILSGSSAAKYINSIENPVFHKSDVLYNLDQAKKRGFKENAIIVVEGYLDVISLFQNGFTNAVAPMGANVKVEQIMQLWDSVNEPIICLDNDNAGRSASYRLSQAILPHLKAGKSLKFCNIKGCKDPDELLEKRGEDGMKEALQQSLSLNDFLFRNELERGGYDTPEQRLKFKESLIELSGKIDNKDLRRLYQKSFLDKWYKVFYSRSTPKLNKGKNDIFSSEIAALMSVKEHEILSILAGCCFNPALIASKEVYEVLLSCEIESQLLSNIRDFLVELSDDGAIVQCSSLEEEVSQKFQITFDKKRLDPILWSKEGNVEAVKNHIIRAFKLHNLRKLNEQIKEMEALLKKNVDAQLFNKLLYLKQQESLLQKEIN